MYCMVLFKGNSRTGKTIPQCENNNKRGLPLEGVALTKKRHDFWVMKMFSILYEYGINKNLLCILLYASISWFKKNEPRS